ncbi:MAG: Rrf2 family transcriptional regulator [Flavobacteriaceae bacterium]|nr:Rrf2 family transcriptional regulator [Flavobacteriaceae bacterium]
MFRKTSEYAIRATIFIAQQTNNGSISTQGQIADAIGSPVAFTAKILQKLARQRLIQSKKGPNGGFYLEKPDQLFLKDIARAIDGNDVLNKCVLGLKGCNDKNPCPIHFQYVAIRDGMNAMLESSSIQDLVLKLQEEKVRLKR